MGHSRTFTFPGEVGPKMSETQVPNTVRLTSHVGSTARFPIVWGASGPLERGPIVAGAPDTPGRNAIGAHHGAVSVYRAVAVAAGGLDAAHVPDLTDTTPTDVIGPWPRWGDPKALVSLDPFGATVSEHYGDLIAGGARIQPSIAVTRSRLRLPETEVAVAVGSLEPDGDILHEDGSIGVTKAAIEPVWYLPGIAERFGVDVHTLRRVLFEQTGGMFPELVTRPDLDIFLPPIGGTTVYIIGGPERLSDGSPVTARVHDECNGSDVFGSDICTCRPYLIQAVHGCVSDAQNGSVGVVAYFRKEGRALGEVTKFLVYNARKRQPGGDVAREYFNRTECVAGVQDARFQQLMPDVLVWLGIDRIERLISMSNEKYDAIVSSGIEVGDRVEIPPESIPADAWVEIEAKRAAGYFSSRGASDLATEGREFD